MKAVIQRVKKAEVSVDGTVTGSCGIGLAILLGVENGDTKEDADLLAAKISKLRIFRDSEGKMNLSVVDVGGSCVVVSQFTLMADYRHGNRPSFLEAAPPDISEPLYEYFSGKLEILTGKKVGKGVFGADIMFEISNEGPVTIIMDSRVLKKSK